MARLVQQWLSTKRKSENPVFVQSTRLDVSAFSICWNPDRVDSDTGEGMNLPVRVSANRPGKQFLLLCLSCRLTAEAAVQIKGGSSHFK